jgi:hypothetical protein
LSAPKSIIVLLLTGLVGAGVAGAQQGRFGQGRSQGQNRDRQQAPNRDWQGQNRDRQQNPSRDWQGQNRDRQQGQQGEYRRGPGDGHAGDWLRQHKDLPPSEQQRALQNDPGFRSLPPETQQRYLDRLRKFNSSPPEQQQQILRRMDRFYQLNPAQRERARDMFQQFRGLPEDRRRMLAPALRNLREMSPQDRQRVLESPTFRSNFTDQERDILRGMTDLDIGPGSRSEAPVPNEVPRPPRY